MLLKRNRPDPLDNLSLDNYLEKLPFERIERLGRGVDIYRLRDLQNKSSVYAGLIAEYLKVPRKINGNKYYLNFGFVERMGPGIQVPTKYHLPFRVEKVLAPIKEIIKN